MKTPILGSAYVARSINAADNRMVNLFPEIVPEGGKEPAFLNRAPGLRLLANVGQGPIRGLWTFNNIGYVVSGTQLFKIDANYNKALLGNVSGTGPVSMTDNGTQLFVACNGPSYIYNSVTTAFSQINDPDFTGAGQVGYRDGYFVYNEPNSQLLWVTSLLDGTQVDPLDFASADGSPDGVVGIIVDHRELWVFGTKTVEVWYDAALEGFPFQRMQGAFNEIGCAAAYSIAKMDNGLFWLGADARGQGIVYRSTGYTGQRISTHAIEYAIAQYGTISDAIGYTYQQEGHSFYVLTFPSGNATWVYDVATQAWHERGAWTMGTNYNPAQFTRHRSNCQMFYNNEVIVGDFENGNIYAFDLDVYSDNEAEQKWLRSWRALPTDANNLKRTAHHSLQLDCESGVGLGVYPADGENTLVNQSEFEITTEDGFSLVTLPYPDWAGYNPQVMLRWSDDAGHTWSNEHWSPMGKIGNYWHRVFWRRLGMTMKLRDRVYEISGTDPNKIVIMGAELLLSPTNA